MNKKLISLFLLALVLCSCGASNSSSSPSAAIETGAILDAFQLKIRTSSNGLPWKNSYTNALNEIFSEFVLDGLFNANIEQEDLDIVGCSGLNNFNFEEKKLFYIAFIAAIAEAESDYEVAQETYNKSDRTMNIGLLQIDQASANRHGSKVFNRDFTSDDLKNPDLNLKIGALILKNQVTGSAAHNRLLPSTAYYWQVLTGSRIRFLKNIKMNLASLRSCSV